MTPESIRSALALIADRERLRDDHHAAVAAIEGRDEIIDERDAQIDTLTADLKSADGTIASLRAELADARNEVTRFEHSNDAWRAETANLLLRAETAEDELAACEKAFFPIYDWYQDDEHDAVPLHERIACAVEDLQSDRQETIDQAAEIRKLKAELAETQANLKRALSVTPEQQAIAQGRPSLAEAIRECVRRCGNVMADETMDGSETCCRMMEHVDKLAALLGEVPETPARKIDDEPLFQQGITEGRADVCAKLRAIVDPGDTNHWSLDGLLQHVEMLRDKCRELLYLRAPAKPESYIYLASPYSASNAYCEKCGGRWLSRCPGEYAGPCPWCEIRDLTKALADANEQIDGLERREEKMLATIVQWEKAHAAANRRIYELERQAETTWRCYHCGKWFNQVGAIQHFGSFADQPPCRRARRK